MESTLVQYIYRRNKMVGATVAVRIGDRVGVSASLCNTKLDRFDKVRALDLAIKRAIVVLSGDRDCPVAHSLRHDVYKMVARATKYFKGLNILASGTLPQGKTA